MDGPPLLHEVAVHVVGPLQPLAVGFDFLGRRQLHEGRTDFVLTGLHRHADLQPADDGLVVLIVRLKGEDPDTPAVQQHL